MKWQTTWAQLSAQPLPGMPILELMEDRRILIENHSGVRAYTDCHIAVGVRFGAVHIEGSRMEIVKMTDNQLVICGSINAIRLERGVAL